MRKPTLHDVARAAGVSYATADRVLNARGGVAEKSIQRVQRAIEDLGYERDVHAANLSRQRSYRFRFLLPEGDHSFFRVLRAAAEAERAPRLADRVLIEIETVPALDPEALADALERTDPQSCDCLTVVASDTPRVTAALQGLGARGLGIVTLVGDAAPDARAVYVGIDNVIAGRTAARLLRVSHRGRPGQILPILGALTARDHRERLEGASAVLAEPGLTEPGLALTFLPALTIQDRPERMREELLSALSRHPDLSAIYSIGAGNRALIEILAKLPGARPFVVVHDLTPVTRAGLENGLIDAIIDQKPARQIASALDVMRLIADNREAPVPPHDLTPTIYLRDNLPPVPEQEI